MTTYHVQDGKIVESGGSALGCLSAIEAFLMFAAGTALAWHHMHPVFAFLVGLAITGAYVLLFFKLFYIVIIASVSFWAYFGYWIGSSIFSGDKIWAVTFAVITGGLAAAEKTIFRLMTKPA